MNHIKRFNLNKNLIVFPVLCFVISTSLRFLIFTDLGLFNNDDYLYHLISNNILNGNGITSDGINPHLFYPPGYPFILSLESFIINDPMIRRSFEWSILTGIVSLGIYIICNLIGIKRRYLASLICFFTPVYIYGTYTLNIATETWFSLISVIGLIFTIKYIKDKNILNLYFANIFFSISYLIRPEGILYFASTISIIIIQIIVLQKKRILKNNLISKKFTLIYISFLLPFLIFIFPYLIYLNSNLGRWTLSGKDTAHEIITSNINTTFLEKLIGLIDVVFLSPFFLGLPITIITVLIFLKFLLNKKTKLPSYDGEKFKYFLVLSTPLIPNIYISLKYWPSPRSIYCFIPSIIPLILLLFENIDYKKFHYKNNLSFHEISFLKNKDFITLFILFALTINLIVPKLLLSNHATWVNNPKLYNKTVNLFRNQLANNKKPLVYSRNFNLAVNNKDFDFCIDFPIDDPQYEYLKHLNCSNRRVDFLILSNLEHQSMQKAKNWELSAINDEKIYYYQQKCDKISTIYTSDKSIKVVGFKCIN